MGCHGGHGYTVHSLNNLTDIPEFINVEIQSGKSCWRQKEAWRPLDCMYQISLEESMVNSLSQSCLEVLMFTAPMKSLLAIADRIPKKSLSSILGTCLGLVVFIFVSVMLPVCLLHSNISNHVSRCCIDRCPC